MPATRNDAIGSSSMGLGDDSDRALVQELQKQVQDLKQQLEEANKAKESAKKLLLVGLLRKLTWRDLPEEWRCDVDIADWCLSNHQANYSDFCRSVQRNMEVLIQFLEYGDKRALTKCERWKYIPDEVLAEEQVVLSVIGCRNFSSWNEVPNTWKRTDSVILAASLVLHNSPDASACYQNLDAVRRVIELGDLPWHRLPACLQNDITFARSLTSHREEDFLMEMLDAHPELRSDLTFWKQLANCERAHNVFESDLLDYADAVILSNRELMLRLCSLCSAPVAYLHASLMHDADFCSEFLKENPHGLVYVCGEEQQWVPLVVEDTLASFARRSWQGDFIPGPWMGEEMLAREMPNSLLNRRSVMEAWVRAGLQVSHDAHCMWSSDSAMAILAANYCTDENVPEFARTFDLLLDERTVMVEVVRVLPELYFDLSDSLKSDENVVLAYFVGVHGDDGRENSTRIMVRTRNARGRSTIVTFRPYCKEQLRLYTTFFSCFLCGMQDPSSPLSLLDQGSEASLAFKKTVAELAGVPTGNKLRYLRLAARHC